MIRTDQELEGNQERITYFCQVVAQMRVTEPAENFPSLAGGFLAEIETMHAEVMKYLRRHATEPTPAEAAW